MPTIDPRKRRLMDDLVYRGEPTDPSDLVYRGEPVDATPLDVGFQRRPSPFAPDVGFLLEEEGAIDPRLDIRKAFRADLGVPDGNFFPATPQSRGLAQRLTQLTAPEPVEARKPSLLDRIRGVVGSDRFRGAAQGIAAVLRPTDEGTAGFLGSAANAFLASRASQDQQAAQREEAAQADRALALRERLAEAAERRTLGTGSSAKYGASVWIPDPSDPTYEISVSKNPATGALSQDELNGQPVRRPKAQPKESVRNIDPLGDEGIRRTAERATKVAEAQSRVAQAPNATQGQAQTFGDRAKAGSDLLNQTATPRLTDFVAGQRLPTELRSNDYRLWRQAAEQFITAVLRKESGAAISDAEFNRYTDIFIPVPGDSPEILKRKKDAREREIANLFRQGRTTVDPEPEVDF